MKPTPPGWPRISPSIFYKDAGKAIDWLCEAFGFETRLRIEGDGGVIVHSELSFGNDGLIMVGTAGLRRKWCRSPAMLDGAATQALMVYVDDVEAHCARARAAGATIVEEPKTTDYGEEYWTDRGYECLDCEGHHWWFYQRLRTPEAKPRA
jgi:uncharacterized glyoxalase superfamily protein PhnB